MLNPDDNEKYVDWLYENAELSTVFGLPGVLSEVMEHYNNEWIEHCEEMNEAVEEERDLDDVLDEVDSWGYEEVQIANLRIGDRIFIYSDVLKEVSLRTPGTVIAIHLHEAAIKWDDGLVRSYPIPMRWYNNCQLLVKEKRNEPSE